MEKNDVLVVGELNVDLILNNIAGTPKLSKEIIAENFTVTTGSSSAIFANNLSVLGSKVAFCGMLGDDSFGSMITEKLEAAGVDTRYIIKDETVATGATVVLNYGADRMMVTYPGAMTKLGEEHVNDNLLRRTKHLHISSVFLQPRLLSGLTKLLERAKALGLTTSIDPQWDPQEQWHIDLASILPLTDVFLPNAKELLLLTKQKNLEEALDIVAPFANIIVVKDGENGALLFNKGEIIKAGAFLNDQVVDCIGAGDSFNAGFINQYIKGDPLTSCLRFGNLTGAVNTTAAGGTGAFTTLEGVLFVGKDRFNALPVN